MDVKRFEKEQSILKNIQDKAKLSSEEVDGLEEKLFQNTNQYMMQLLILRQKT